MSAAAADLLSFADGRRFGTILADPPWRFQNKTGKVAPEHRRLSRYGTMSFEEIEALPVPNVAASISHLYLWCPNALLPQGLSVLQAWGLLTNPISSGIRSERMAVVTVAGSASTSAMSPSWYSLVRAAKMLGPARLGGAR